MRAFQYIHLRVSTHPSTVCIYWFGLLACNPPDVTNTGIRLLSKYPVHLYFLFTDSHLPGCSLVRASAILASPEPYPLILYLFPLFPTILLIPQPLSHSIIFFYKCFLHAVVSQYVESSISLSSSYWLHYASTPLKTSSLLTLSLQLIFNRLLHCPCFFTVQKPHSKHNILQIFSKG